MLDEASRQVEPIAPTSGERMICKKPHLPRGLFCDISGKPWGEKTTPSETVLLATMDPIDDEHGNMPRLLFAFKSELNKWHHVDRLYPYSYGGAWLSPIDQIASLLSLVKQFSDELDDVDAAALINYQMWLTYRVLDHEFHTLPTKA